MCQDIESSAIRSAKQNTNRTLWHIDAARHFALQVINHHLFGSQIDVLVMILRHAFATPLCKQSQVGNRSLISYISFVCLFL